MKDQLLTDLEERIRNGEAYLGTLSFDDPKRITVQAKIKKLREQAREIIQKPEHSQVTVHTFDRTYDRKQVSENVIHRDHWHDPRPDLLEDSAHWAVLLELAHEYDDDLCAVLNGFRCGGTRLKFGETRWVLRPDIDTLGRSAWPSLDEYDEAREKYLKEWTGVIGAMLDELTRRVPAGVAPIAKQQEVPPPPSPQVIQTVMQI